ncbi:MAG: hypothetical protein R3F19_13015 [Verrucomicrobiales bacterium]
MVRFKSSDNTLHYTKVKLYFPGVLGWSKDAWVAFTPSYTGESTSGYVSIDFLSSIPEVVSHNRDGGYVVHYEDFDNDGIVDEIFGGYLTLNMYTVPSVPLTPWYVGSEQTQVWVSALDFAIDSLGAGNGFKL